MARSAISVTAVLAFVLHTLPVTAARGADAPDTLVAAGPKRTVLAAGDTTRAPIDLSMGQPVIEVFLNGRGPYRMFLDTGAGTTVLDQSLARELGLAKRGETRLGDPADPRAILADVVTIDTLRIGTALRPGVDRPRGVVGLPVFRELLETIDFPAAMLRLWRGHLGEPGGAILHYRSMGGVPLIPIDVAGAAMEAHLDTGSPSFLSIPEKDSSLVHFAGPLREVGRGRTVNSVVMFRGAPLDGAVRVGGASFDRPLVVLNDRLPVPILGSRALRDCVVTLDAANQRVRIESTRQSAPDTPKAPPAQH